MTTTRYFTVRAFGAAPQEHIAAIASLPAELRLIGGGRADIALVQPERGALGEALEAAPGAIVLDRPADLDSALHALLDRTAVPVIAVLKLAASLKPVDAQRPLVSSALIRSRLRSAEPLNTAVLEHLAGLSAILGELSNLRMLGGSGNNYAAIGRTRTHAEVAWSGQAGVANPHYELDIVGVGARLEVTGTVDRSARPLTVRLATAEGLVQPIGVFETGLRLFWRDVAATLSDGTAATPWGETKALLDQAAALASTSFTIDAA
jgi:hypothetical protein